MPACRPIRRPGALTAQGPSSARWRPGRPDPDPTHHDPLSRYRRFPATAPRPAPAGAAGGQAGGRGGGGGQSAVIGGRRPCAAPKSPRMRCSQATARGNAHGRGACSAKAESQLLAAAHAMIGIYSGCCPAKRPIASAMPPLVLARRHWGTPHDSADVERASWTWCARAGWRTGAFEALNRPMQRQRRRRSPAPAGGGRQVPCTPLGGCCETPTGARTRRAGRAGAGHAAPAWAGPRATAPWRRTRGGRAPARRMQGSVPGAPGARARHGARAPAPSAGTGRSAARCAQSRPARPPLRLCPPSGGTAPALAPICPYPLQRRACAACRTQFTSAFALLAARSASEQPPSPAACADDAHLEGLDACGRPTNVGAYS